MTWATPDRHLPPFGLEGDRKPSRRHGTVAPPTGRRRLTSSMPGFILWLATRPSPALAHAPDFGEILASVLMFSLPTLVLAACCLLALLTGGWYRLRPAAAWAGLIAWLALGAGGLAWIYSAIFLLFFRGPWFGGYAIFLVVIGVIMAATFRMVSHPSTSVDPAVPPPPPDSPRSAVL